MNKNAIITTWHLFGLCRRHFDKIAEKIIVTDFQRGNASFFSIARLKIGNVFTTSVATGAVRQVQRHNRPEQNREGHLARSTAGRHQARGKAG